jgi:hypothetical protein
MHKFLKFIFGIKLSMFRTVPLSIIRSFSLYAAMGYVIQVCWQLASRIRMKLRPDPARLLCIQWKTPGDGQRNCPKHAEFYSINIFEKLVHLVGFIIRIYHDVQSPEHQKWSFSLVRNSDPIFTEDFIYFVMICVSAFIGSICIPK